MTTTIFDRIAVIASLTAATLLGCGLEDTGSDNYSCADVTDDPHYRELELCPEDIECTIIPPPRLTINWAFQDQDEFGFGSCEDFSIVLSNRLNRTLYAEYQMPCAAGQVIIEGYEYSGRLSELTLTGKDSRSNLVYGETYPVDLMGEDHVTLTVLLVPLI